MWNKKSIVLVKIGLKHIDFELHVYYQINSDYTIIVTVYVDKLLILSKNTKEKRGVEGEVDAKVQDERSL
jgi:hypothetical protein